MACLILLGVTYFQTKVTIQKYEAEVVRSDAAFQALRKARLGDGEDATTVDELDPGGVMRADIENNLEKPGESPPPAADGK